MSNPATIEDLSNRSLRPLTPAELSVGAVLLEDAYDIIVNTRPSVETRLEASPPVQSFERLVIQVLCAMALRVLNNPDGLLEESEDTYRYRRDAAVSTGALYLSDAELVRLSAGDDSSDSAFTISPFSAGRAGYWSGPDTWTPIA